VSICFSVTVTPGSTAPLSSVTTPVIVPVVSCARRLAASVPINHNATNVVTENRANTVRMGLHR
jgi:hypothetical protein